MLDQADLAVSLADLKLDQQQLRFLEGIYLLIATQGDEIMGRLDAITAALVEAQSTAADEAAQVQEHLARLGTQIDELKAALEAATTDITQAELDALAAQAGELKTTIEAIDTEGEGVPEEPPV
jgi:predicted  nucleic acid-binding Zn-ribbon protein